MQYQYATCKAQDATLICYKMQLQMHLEFETVISTHGTYMDI